MKKIVYLVAVLFALLSFAIPTEASSLKNHYFGITLLTDIIYVEYVEIGDQLFKFTYYSDGSFEAQAVGTTEP